MKIKIWSKYNSDEEGADEVEIDDLPDNPTELEIWSFWYSVECAVKDFAEEDHPHSDCWEQSTFHALVGNTLKTYDVYVEMEPAFYISELNPKVKSA
jgi:hypothetical protein